MKNSMLTPAKHAKHKAKAERPKSDDAYNRNFTKKGTPKLNASSKPSGTGEGAMGQRR